MRSFPLRRERTQSLLERSPALSLRRQRLGRAVADDEGTIARMGYGVCGARVLVFLLVILAPQRGRRPLQLAKGPLNAVEQYSAAMRLLQMVIRHKAAGLESRALFS